MASKHVGTGIVAYTLGLFLVPYMSYAIANAYQGPVVGTLIALLFLSGLIAGAYFGVRHQGLSFFASVGEWVDSWGEDEKKASAKAKKSARVARPSGPWAAKLIVQVGDQCERVGCRARMKLQVHHIHDHAKGGTNSLSNLLVLCPNCHGLCGDRVYSYHRQKQWANREGRFKDPKFPAAWHQNIVQRDRAALAAQAAA